MRSFWARNRPHPSDICRDTELSYHVLYMCRHVSVHSTHNDIFCWYFEVENGNYYEHSDKIHDTWTLSNVHRRMSIISNNLLQWGAMLISLADYDVSNHRAQDCYVLCFYKKISPERVFKRSIDITVTKRSMLVSYLNSTECTSSPGA